MYKVLGVTEKLQVKVKIEVKNKTTNPHLNSGQWTVISGQKRQKTIMVSE